MEKPDINSFMKNISKKTSAIDKINADKCFWIEKLKKEPKQFNVNLNLTQLSFNELEDKLTNANPKYDCVSIDTVEHLKIDQKFSSPFERMSFITNSLQELAKKHNCVVMVGMQGARNESMQIENMIKNSKTFKESKHNILFV